MTLFKRKHGDPLSYANKLYLHTLWESKYKPAGSDRTMPLAFSDSERICKQHIAAHTHEIALLPALIGTQIEAENDI